MLVEKLYEKYNASDRNFLLSPYSIHMALAMAKEGARGETLRQMEAVLGEDPKFLDIETLKVANAIWLRAVPGQAWKEIVTTKYRGETRDIQDVSNPESLINSWVYRKTNGKIPSILPEGSLTPEDKMIITNAIHFKDDWSDQFKEERTKRQPFYAPGVTTTTKLMYSMRNVPYVETNRFQAIQLRYSDARIHMVVVLPKTRDGIVTVEDLSKVRKLYFRTEEVKIHFPKFVMRHTYSLEDILTEMGMGIAFSDFADFNGITRDVKIGKVLHKTFIDVDEEGTEAAAVTAIGFLMVSAMMSPPKREIIFRADHPFAFYISDRKTNTIIFVGGFKKPKD